MNRPESTANANRERTAFVLAGGGSLGAVQVGMLHELIASGMRPDLIVGVSAGALNGAFLAFDPSLATIQHMEELWCRVRTRDILGLSLGSILGLIGLRGHVGSSRGLRRLLERELPYRGFDQARIPLHIVASDQREGTEVILSAGMVIDAVLASTAIPGVFPPVVIDGRHLVDGVVAAGTPLTTAVRLGATRLVVIPCGFTCVHDAVPRHALGRAMHAITLLGAGQLRRDFAAMSERVRICIVPTLCPLRQSVFDYSQGAALVAAARETTRRWVDGDGLSRSEFPDPLRLHSH